MVLVLADTGGVLRWSVWWRWALTRTRGFVKLNRIEQGHFNHGPRSERVAGTVFRARTAHRSTGVAATGETHASSSNSRRSVTALKIVNGDLRAPNAFELGFQRDRRKTSL